MKHDIPRSTGGGNIPFADTSFFLPACEGDLMGAELDPSQQEGNANIAGGVLVSQSKEDGT